jgi:hypothetical protein
MDMAAEKHLYKLAEILRLYLSRPLRLDTDAAEFVTSTYGDAGAETIRALMADTDASEAETLLEFLLFPDIKFQIQIEPLLSRYQSRHLPQRRLRAHLGQPPITLTLHTDAANEAKVGEVGELGDVGDVGDKALRLSLPDDFLERFLARLNLAKRWPASLEEVLDRYLPCDAGLRARVMLRNGPPLLEEACLHLYGDLVRTLSPHHRDFWAALELVVRLGPELAAGNDPFSLLTAHKRRAFQMVERQREFERRLQHSNIEILLGQGQRVPTLARAEALKQMRVIDVVCQSIFGRTTYFQPAAFG